MHTVLYYIFFSLYIIITTGCTALVVLACIVNGLHLDVWYRIKDWRIKRKIKHYASKYGHFQGHQD
jgi:hypothetical protein